MGQTVGTSQREKADMLVVEAVAVAEEDCNLGLVRRGCKLELLLRLLAPDWQNCWVVADCFRDHHRIHMMPAGGL